MPRYDTDFQAFRRERLHQYRNMDPDDLVCELDISTDELLDKHWEMIENRIEDDYEKETYIDEDERDAIEEPPFDV